VPRIVFAKGTQGQFLKEIKQIMNTGTENLALNCGVHPRTIRDWQREKYLISGEAVTSLQKISGIPCPKILEILPDYWSTKKAGQVGARGRLTRYGNPGTAEGRRRGGFTAYKKMKQSGLATGFKFRRAFVKPEPSALLAEFLGIMLGDGGIGPYQISISLNATTDADYVDFVVDVISQLFGLIPSQTTRKNACNIVISSIGLIEFLCQKGLVRGNKVTHQVTLPSWILQDPDFVKASLRGLMDTDGSIYSARHTIAETKYTHACLCFRNYSKPLLDTFYHSMINLKYHPKRGHNRIYLYRQKEIKRYFQEIGSHNPKHLTRYKAVTDSQHIAQKNSAINRRGRKAV
jgi:LAGLIDADG DNA endonuclease family protein